MSQDFPQGTTTPAASAAAGSVDGAQAQGGEAVDIQADDTRTYRAVPEHAGGRTSRQVPLIGGVVGALAAVVGLVLWLRGRRKPPTPQERLAESAQALGGAAMGLGGRAATRAASAAVAAEPVVRDAAAIAGSTAKEAASLAAGTAKDAASLAAGTAKDAVGITAEGAKKVATVAADGAREVVDGVEAVQKAWHKLVTRLIVIVFGGAGYVLGAKAGRERYDQIVGAAQKGLETVRR
jgi:hypothetical protein